MIIILQQEQPLHLLLACLGHRFTLVIGYYQFSFDGVVSDVTLKPNTASCSQSVQRETTNQPQYHYRLLLITV